VVDDGSVNIRAVFFGDQAEKILGMKTDEVLNFASGGRIADIYRQPANLGKDFIIRGRVKKDIMAERLEIMVNSIEEIDIAAECERLMGG